MADQPMHNPKDFAETLRLLTIDDPAHADTFNTLFERLINNDAFLKACQGDLANLAQVLKDAGADGSLVEAINEVTAQMAELTADTMKLGSNSTVNKVKAAELKVDTRTTELVYNAGNLEQVLEKDGLDTVKTTTLNYDANGNLTSVVEVADGVSVTTTLNYNSTTGDLESVTKAVV